KDSFGDLTTLVEYVRAVPAGFAVFQGRDTLIEPALAYGAAGAVPGTANIVPHLAVAIYEAHRRGDYEAARAAQLQFSPLRLAPAVGAAPGAVRAARTLRGVGVGSSRLPTAPLSGAQRQPVQAVLGRLRA